MKKSLCPILILILAVSSSIFGMTTAYLYSTQTVLLAEYELLRQTYASLQARYEELDEKYTHLEWEHDYLEWRYEHYTIPSVYYKFGVYYEVVAQKLDIAAVDSYPQTIIEDESNASRYRLSIEVKIDPHRIGFVRFRNYTYDPSIAEYLEPTSKIESNSTVIGDLADSFRDSTDILTLAFNVANWTSSHIGFDHELAREISAGNVDTQSAVKTLERRKGTCSEYTNVFIAIMRNLGVPTRFISGIMYGGVYHAWAEVYLYGVGWIPVDPQACSVNYRAGLSGSNYSFDYVKLFAGKDFVDIGVKLREIGAYVTEIDM